MPGRSLGRIETGEAVTLQARLQAIAQAPGVVSVDPVLAAVAERDPALAAKLHTQAGRDGKKQLNLFDPNHTRVELMDFEPSAPSSCAAFTGPQPKPEP